MELFTCGTAPVDASFVDGVAWRVSDQYREAKVALNGGWYPVYVIRVSDTACAAVTCWGQYLDVILTQLEKTPQILSTTRKLRPTLFRMIDNAVAEQYGNGAYVEFLDPDDLNRKWFVAVLFPADDGEVGAASGAAGAAMEKVLAISVDMAVEANNRPSGLDYVKVFALGAARGAGQGMAQMNRVREQLQWLEPQLGA